VLSERSRGGRCQRGERRATNEERVCCHLGPSSHLRAVLQASLCPPATASKKPLKFPWQHGRKPCTEAGTGVTLIWELQNRNESSDCHVAAYSLMPLGLAALSLIILAACFVLSDVFAWRHTGSASGPCQSPTVSSLYMSTVPSIPSVINRTGTSSQSLPSPRPSMGIAPILQRDCTLVLRMRCESIIKNVPLLRMNSNWIST